MSLKNSRPGQGYTSGGDIPYATDKARPVSQRGSRIQRMMFHGHMLCASQQSLASSQGRALRSRMYANHRNLLVCKIRYKIASSSLPGKCGHASSAVDVHSALAVYVL